MVGEASCLDSGGRDGAGIIPPHAAAHKATLTGGIVLSQAPANPESPRKPRTRLGDYEVLETLGRGGMGVVYRARHAASGRDVALKILPRELASDEVYVARFRREAQAAARLIHPNIVLVYDSGIAGGLHFIALEYVEGQPLDRLIRQQGALAEEEIVEVALAVSRALWHAHSKGVLHRDVSTGNILVTRGGEVKLADFGMAKYEASHQTFKTTIGRVFGTPAFLSPEQALGAQDVDRRADIYSLGCVIYNMATGRPPFEGDNPFAVIDQHRRAKPTPVRTINPRISVALEALIDRAMAKGVEQRYQSAEEMVIDLEAIRRALKAPQNVRGGLAQFVRAMDEITAVGRRIRAAQVDTGQVGWRMRLTAAFLARPLFWFAFAGAVFVAAVLASLWVGVRIGSGRG